MGTNYYHRFNHCDCCGRYDERHIGKNLTMFQGYRPDPYFPEEFTGPEITAWAQWKEVLRTEGEIWDEHGRQWDIDEFIAQVERTEKSTRRRQYDSIVDHYVDHRMDWIDADGFSFHEGEFT